MSEKPEHFLYFDEYENAWLQASSEEIVMRNDPELFIIPVYEGGKQGKQCTWKEFENAARKKQWGAPKRPSTPPQSTPSATSTQNASQPKAAVLADHAGLARAINGLKSTVEPTCELVSYTCRFFIAVFYINCICAGLAVGAIAFEAKPLGLVIGVALGAACIILVRAVASVMAKK